MKINIETLNIFPKPVIKAAIETNNRKIYIDFNEKLKLIYDGILNLPKRNLVKEIGDKDENR